MSRFIGRPRAPSPPGFSRPSFMDDGGIQCSENAYSVVQDNVPERPPPKTTHFGDPGVSTGKKSTDRIRKEAPLNLQTRAFEDRATRQQGQSHYDTATVEQIKAQFQRQIEEMLKSQETHKVKTDSSTKTDPNTGSSFQEARTAVQKQIERMFPPGGVRQQGPPQGKMDIKHTMHGVSHAIPDERNIQPPPPMHYGVNQALRNRSRKHEGGEDKTAINSVKSVFREEEEKRGNNYQQESIANMEEANLQSDNSQYDNSSSLPSSSAYSSSGSSTSSHSNRTESSSSSVSSFQPKTATETFRKGYIKHKVDYLGALPISSKSTNLAALQRPLKDLYFKFRAMRNLGHSNLPGTLEINDTGLTVQYIRELHKGVQEIFNPFSTIAVWAAVKFVHKRDVVGQGLLRHRFAFLPLISDPDSEEKHRLFHHLDLDDVELAADAPHPPIFACVMRRAGAPKQLECHGFVCTSSEDAIILAANLYQSLLETMKKQRRRLQQKQSLSRRASMRRIAQKQTEKSEQESEEGLPLAPPPTFSDDEQQPTRPPRKRTTKETSVLSRKKSFGSSMRKSRGNRSGRIGKRPATIDPTRKSFRALGRTDSARRSSTKPKAKWKNAAYHLPTTPAAPSGGDVYTRVAIPRSKSFMNVNNQYNLQELFRELKEKEGVESIDDVLKKVITPNGISFNEIKPVYRELLLKLAMTMSQDEIFQRSKNIINQEKKKSGKKSALPKADKGKKSKKGGKDEQSTLGSFFKMTFSSNKGSSSVASKASLIPKEHIRLKPLPSLPPEVPLLSRSLSATALNANHVKMGLTKADISGPLPLSRNSTSTLPRSSSVSTLKAAVADEQTDDAYVSCTECGYESVCTYDSCATCSCKATKASGKKLNDKSGSRKISSPAVLCQSDFTEESELYCDCDNDSCHSMDKCYCSLRGHSEAGPIRPPIPGVYPSKGNKTIIQCHGNGMSTVRSTSSAYSCSICMHGEGPNSACYSTKHQNYNAKEKNRKNTDLSSRSGNSGYLSNESSSSHESIQAKQKPQYSRCSSQASQLAGGERRYSDGSYSFHSSSSLCSNQSRGVEEERKRGSSKMLVLSAVDKRGKVMYHGSSTTNSTRTPVSQPNEKNILSMKKSAEIAATFSGVRINQTTDIVGIAGDEDRISEYDSTDAAYDTKQNCACSSKGFTRANMHSSLGYFP